MCRQFEEAGGPRPRTVHPCRWGTPATCWPPGTAGRTWGPGGRAVRRFWDHANGATPVAVLAPVRPRPPGDDAVRARHQQPPGPAGLRRRARRPRRRERPVRRGARDPAVHREDGVRFPIHGGSGDPHGDFNAMWTSWVSGHLRRPPRRLQRHVDELGVGPRPEPAGRRVVVRPGRDVERRALPRRPDRPHVRRVGEPCQPSLHRPDQACSATSGGCWTGSADLRSRRRRPCG